MDVFTTTSTLSLLGVVVSIILGIVTILAYRLGFYDLLFSRVDKEYECDGGHLVAETLKAHGVKYIFTLCGGHISTILVGCEKLGIRVIDTRHEVTCAFAADAVARLSGIVGVACVTAGPGLTNTVTAVKNAQMAESPLLLLGGAAAKCLKGRGALQDIDQMVLFKPLCKYTASISRVRDIVPTIREAIAAAQSGTPGPVFVEIPIDVLYPIKLVEQELFPKTKPRTLVQHITALYIKAYIAKVFGNAWTPQDTSPLPVDRPFCRESDVKKVARLVRKAKKPLFLLGSQVTLPPVKGEDKRRYFEKMGIPCFLGGMSRGLLGPDSNIHIRQRRRDALKEADLVILVGAVCDFRLNYGRSISSKSAVVAVNRNKTQLKLNTDMFWTPTISLQGDPGFFIQQLAENLDGYECDPSWPEMLKERDKEKEAINLEKTKEIPDRHLNPLKVLHLSEQVMSDNTIMVADGGDFVGSASYILRPRGPLKWLDPGPFGTLGVGGGFALGAKLCCPESDVWIIYGDGSLGYSVAEFDTFTRHQIPVIALIGNDACWSQIAREQVPQLGSNVGCMLAYCEYEKVAEGYGGRGYVLDRGMDDDAIKDVLVKAQDESRTGRPVLVNCLIGTTDFRKGSISV